MTNPERRSQDLRREALQKRAPLAVASDTPTTVLTIVAALVGAGLICWGIYQIYPPATPIFAGVLIWLGAARVARERKEARDATTKNG